MIPRNGEPRNAPAGPTDWSAAYRELKDSLAHAGLLRPDPASYLPVGVACCALLVGSVGLALAAPPTATGALLPMVLLGFSLVQLALLGHDAGHTGVFGRPRLNWLLGSLCWTLTLGVGFASWRRDHNLHHGRPNDPASDPGLQTGGLIAFSDEMALTRSGWARALGRRQALLYVLGIPLLAFFLRGRGWYVALVLLKGRERIAEVALLAASAALWALPVALVGLWWGGVLFGAQLVAGVYLGLVFAPHHKGMPVWAWDRQLSYLERQVLTARNVRPHPVGDVLFGGLNYQIEHHLFPTMPRSHLRRARDIVLPFCLAHGLPYEETSAIDSYRRILTELSRLGELPVARDQHLSRWS